MEDVMNIEDMVPATPTRLRFVERQQMTINERGDGYRIVKILQQLWRGSRGDEWRDVPLETEP